jgi:hypothetical protein
MPRILSRIGLIVGALTIATSAIAVTPRAQAALLTTERHALAPALPSNPIEMRGRGGFRGGFRGGGFRGGFRGGGFRGGWGGPRRFGGGWGGPRRFGGWHRPGPRWGGPGWRRPGWGYGVRRPWGPPMIAAPFVGGGWRGGGCRRVLRMTPWGPTWVTRCCRVVVGFDGFPQRVCRRVG